MAAEGFLRATVLLEGNVLTLSKILSWYRKDFPKSDEEMIAWIAQFLDEAHPLRGMHDFSKIKIAFSEYDWSQNKQDGAKLGENQVAIAEQAVVEAKE